VEANLAEEAIDYAKGCYIGQEVISRMKMSGQLNKRLCGLIPVDGAPLAAPMRLVSLADEKDAGWLTSAIRSERFGEIALAYVKRGFNEPGTVLHARAETTMAPADATRVKVVDLPFR
jgi:folate-binding Fe-S cluster repair protein YgfZ